MKVISLARPNLAFTPRRPTRRELIELAKVAYVRKRDTELLKQINPHAQAQGLTDKLTYNDDFSRS